MPLLNVHDLLLPPKHPHLFLEARNISKTGWRQTLVRARVKVTKTVAATKKKTEATKNRTAMKNRTITTTAMMGMTTKATRKL